MLSYVHSFFLNPNTLIQVIQMFNSRKWEREKQRERKAEREKSRERERNGEWKNLNNI